MSWEELETYDHSKALSPSAMKTYMRCPKQFEFSYVLGIKKKPAFRMVFGSSVHRGIETNYAHKFVKKKDMKITDVQAVFADDIKQRVKKEDCSVAKAELGAAVDEGVLILDRYHKNVAPHVQPVLAPETELVTEVPGLKRKIRGFIDLVADVKSGFGSVYRNVVRDTKTTTRMFTQEQADTDIQLTTYQYLLKAVKKIMASKVQFDVIVRKAGEPTLKPVTSERSMAHLKRFEQQVVAIDKGIKSGIFYPTDNHQTCSWCGYADMCHKGRSWAARP